MESTTYTSNLLLPAEEEAMEKVNDGLVRVEETLDSSGVIVCRRKRRKDDDVDRDEKIKKRRVDWTPELHQKFERVVNHLGLDKCGPKKILEMMGVPWLRREQVASHLQKYRLQKQKEQKEAKTENTCFETNAINLHQNYFVAGIMNMQMQMPRIQMPIPIQRGSEDTNANTNTVVDHNRPIFVAPLNPSRPIVPQSNIPFNPFPLPPFPTREEDIRLRNIDSFGWANQQPGVARDLNIEDELFRGPNRHQIVDEMPFIRQSPNRYQIVDEMPFIPRICGDDDCGSKSGK